MTRQSSYLTPDQSAVVVDWSADGSVRLTWKPTLRPSASIDGWTAGLDPFYEYSISLSPGGSNRSTKALNSSGYLAIKGY